VAEGKEFDSVVVPPMRTVESVEVWQGTSGNAWAASANDGASGSPLLLRAALPPIGQIDDVLVDATIEAALTACGAADRTG
jgi:hypothetical protein